MGEQYPVRHKKSDHKGRLFLFLSMLESNLFGELFLDTSSLAAELTKVVELSLTHITPTFDAYAVHQLTVCLECTFYTNTMRDLAHGESRVEAAVALAQHDTFKSLQTLATSLLHLYLHNHGITGAELR